MMQNRKKVYQFLISFCVFAIAFAMLMYYLQYEGVISYQYLFGDDIPLTLFPDQAETIRIQEDQYRTEYVQDLTMTFPLNCQRISSVRILFSDAPEKYSAIGFEGMPAESKRPVTITARNLTGKNEFLFDIPYQAYDSISIRLNHQLIVDSIEVYESSSFGDESKSVPGKLNLVISAVFALLLAGAVLASEINWKEGKGFGFPVLYLLFEISMLRYILKTRSYPAYSQEIELIMWALFVLASLTMLAAYRMLFVHHSPLHKVFALCSVAMGVVMMLLIQPFCVPDEGTHYYQAYIRSNEMLGKAAVREHEIRWEDLCFLEKQAQQGWQVRYEKYPVLAEEMRQSQTSGESKKFIYDGKLEHVPLGYVFSGLGLTIARVLGLNGAQAYYAGRLLNLLVYIGAITLVIYWLPFGKAAVFVLALAPVSMQQAASYSYDPVVTAISFLFVAYALRLYAQEKTVSLRQYLFACILAILLGPSKAVYAPLSMSMLLIPAKKYGFGKKKWSLNILIIILAFVMLFVIQMKTFLEISAPQQEAAAEITKYSIPYLLNNIRETIKLFLTDYEWKGDFYYRYFFSELLGWHQLDAHRWLTTLFYVLFIMGCQRSDQETECVITQWKRWGAIVVLMGVVTLTQLTMLMAWTPFGATVIEGVQGRYFIPALIVLIPVLRNSQIKLTSNANKWCTILGIWACWFSVISLLRDMPK